MNRIMPVDDGKPKREWPGPARPEFKNLSYEDYHRCASKFRSVLHALGDATFYWVPTTMTIMGRTTRPGVRARPVPAKAIAIGTYGWPHSGKLFAQDLDATITSFKNHT